MSAMAEPIPLTPGAIFAGHRIEGLAGRGGMGVVYRATHLALDHVVALKVISPQLADDERFRRRFEGEVRIAVSIRHPNVVPIHHAGEEDGLLFVTMDFIEGTDLRGLLRRERRLTPGHAVRIVDRVASALDAAHAQRARIPDRLRAGPAYGRHHRRDRDRGVHRHPRLLGSRADQGQAAGRPHGRLRAGLRAL
jgi:serine/threonine protein kinase